jgi:hypothetical protein
MKFASAVLSAAVILAAVAPSHSLARASVAVPLSMVAQTELVSGETRPRKTREVRTFR